MDLHELIAGLERIRRHVTDIEQYEVRMGVLTLDDILRYLNEYKDSQKDYKKQNEGAQSRGPGFRDPFGAYNRHEEFWSKYSGFQQSHFEDLYESLRQSGFFEEGFFRERKGKRAQPPPPPPPGVKTWWEILGVKVNANAATIKKAYRKLAQVHHPDKPGGNKEKFQEINAAYKEGIGGL